MYIYIYIVPGISGDLVVKSKLPPVSASSLEAVEPHPKKGHKVFFICIYSTIKMHKTMETELSH